MGRLEKKVNLPEETFSLFQQTEENVSQNDIEEYYRHKKSGFSGIGKKLRNFGFTRDSHAMASDIERNPSPKGALKMTFYGRPLDLHMLEDYLVWRTSPLAIKTILRYGHAKTIEDFRGLLSSGERAKGNPKALMMIVLIVIFLIAGIMFLLYGPQLGTLMGFG